MANQTNREIFNFVRYTRHMLILCIQKYEMPIEVQRQMSIDITRLLTIENDVRAVMVCPETDPNWIEATAIFKRHERYINHNKKII